MYTESLIAINPSTLFTKYCVKNVSPIRFSCGMILSKMEIILVCLLPFTILQIVPKQGAINGNQNFTTKTSGFCFLIFKPTFIQLNGLMEFTETCIVKFSGFGNDEYCVVPGNKNSGYCKENVSIVTSSFSCRNSFAKRSLYAAKPPRNGCAEPRITTFIP